MRYSLTLSMAVMTIAILVALHFQRQGIEQNRCFTVAISQLAADLYNEQENFRVRNEEAHVKTFALQLLLAEAFAKELDVDLGRLPNLQDVDISPDFRDALEGSDRCTGLLSE